ncbi:tyrosine-type recombinase/integrase [Herbaspirillum frisingense]|uniref:tyrosine-type recombinase/integrase n=1 Tax=Herbaspirillum frisingense TaxID=92645 RepID=UPI001F308511|nr:site-specific integrase [Herbaspirillum frisingense]UIN23497.1 integrase arm-type DNA-binding domain-containing protein [Herbaspirillum frisingense]
MKKEPGYYCDGDGLYLQVSKSGSKSWVLRYRLNGKSREMGLGSLTVFSLAEARERCRMYRQMLVDGVDPISSRQAAREQNIQATANRRTFAECALEYQRLHADGWKNVKHANQWINTLTMYAFPVFGKKDVSLVNKADVLKVLEPIWAVKTETASRVRQRIRAVLDWSAARDYRVNHDPHLWEQINRALPSVKALKKTSHFASCPYAQIASVIQNLQTATASPQLKGALEFIILTAARSGEVRGAVWAEIDFAMKRWTIPAERMKSAREHRVPLSTRAIAILEAQKERSNGDLIFPSDKGKAFSDMAFTMLVRRLNYDFTVHGFRSTFRDWSAEQTAFPREVCEAALAHVTKDATEAAYFRSDLFEKRRQLMDAWATYVQAVSLVDTED